MRRSLFFLLALAGTPVAAGLGGPPAQLNAVSAIAMTVMPSPGAAAYTELRKTLASGTVVHEYVNANGVVFAVSWAGPFLPDLQALLGAHFATLVSYQQSQTRGARSQIVVQESGVTIVSAGGMGAFEGKAWLPALLPIGFYRGVLQ